MFSLDKIALNLGVDIEQGGLSIYESNKDGETVSGGSITLTNSPVAFDGAVIGWYKRPADKYWTVGIITGNTMSIPGATGTDRYCIKYFYQNENARSLTIKTQYVPKVLHVVIINDLFSGNPTESGVNKYGRLITDIPAFQLSGSQDLNLTSTSAATVSLTGSALAVESGDSCEEEPYYGTMTEEIFGTSWKDNVVALAVENGVIELASAATENLIIRAVFGGSVASKREPNDNFVFAVESGNATVNDTGMITGGTEDSTISVTLKNYPNIVAYAYVEVAD